MSLKIIETYWSWYNPSLQLTEIRALIECDTLTDLPGINSITGYQLTIGTIAHVIDTNSTYKMQSGGAWKVQSAGTDVYTKAETDALFQSSKDYSDSLIDALDVPAVGGPTRYVYQISESNGKISALSYAADTTPTAGSTKLIQSAGVKNYVDTAVSGKAAVSDIYGLGIMLSDVDLNTILIPGLYTCLSVTAAATITNAPISGSAFRLEVKLINNANRVRQEFYPVSDIAACYVRSYTAASGGGSSWKSWYLITGTPI